MDKHCFYFNHDNKPDYSIVVSIDLNIANKCCSFGATGVFLGDRKEMRNKVESYKMNNINMMSFDDLCIFLELKTNDEKNKFINDLKTGILYGYCKVELNETLSEEEIVAFSKKWTHNIQKITTKQINTYKNKMIAAQN